jgi:hypothetical protein
MRFESMREDGIEPATYAPEQDRVVNRTNAVKPMPAEARASYVSPYEADYKKSEEMAAVELQKQKAEEMQRMIDAGVVADDPESMRNRERITREARQAPQQAPPEIYRKRGPTIWDLEKREKEQLAELNRPIGELIEEMKKMGNVVQEKPEKKE